jgi:hypothetical protein
MTPKELVKYYGSEAKAAAGLGKSITCIRMWEKEKRIPVWSQNAIQTITNGALMASKK